MTSRFILLLLFIHTVGFGLAQSNPLVKDTGTGILEFKHPAGSMSGNYVHDKLLYLTINSEDIRLPENVIQSLVVMNDPLDLADKFRHQREMMLKILYNPRVSRADKEFVQNYLKTVQGDEVLESLLPFFADYLSN